MAGNGAGDVTGSVSQETGPSNVPRMIQEMDRMVKETEDMEERLINMEIETALMLTEDSIESGNFNLFIEMMRHRIEKLSQSIPQVETAAKPDGNQN